MKKFYSCCKTVCAVLVTIFSLTNAQATCNANIDEIVIYNLTNGSTTTLYDGISINASSLPANWNIEAKVSGNTIGSVKFIFSGDYTSSNTENSYPYRTPTDNVALNLAPGTYTLLVKVYYSSGCSGSICDYETITFTITGGCDNLTSAGVIAGGGTGCSPYDPPLITSSSLPSGGSGDIEYVWIKRTYQNGSWSSWSSPIPGANGPTYDPEPITIKTQFRRCARRAGCTSYVGESNNITFYVTDGITASCTKTDGTCANGNLGSISVSASGGSGYSYLWSNGETSSSIDNLAAGTYTVTVTDANNCTATCSKTVSVASNCCETLGITYNAIRPGCEGGDVCDLSSYSLSGHSLWLNSIAGVSNDYHWDGEGKFVAFDDGTAHISGTVVNENDPNKKWVVNMWFSNKMNWNEWSALGRTWKGTASIVGDNYLDWDYYIFDASKTSNLVGLGDFAGKELVLTHRPANLQMGLQIGTAANDKNGNYGMSTWFFFNGNGGCSYSGYGDLNVNGQCVENSCNAGADITVSNGAAPYTFAWSNGSTSEDLSGVCAGTYTVTVTDKNGCGGTKTVTVPGAQNCCDNVTDGGEIGHPQENCGPFDPEPLVSLGAPSGGSGNIEYVWLVSTNGGVNYTAVPNSNSATYDPGTISVTTWYRRCARREGCVPYPGESNWIKLTVNDGPSVSCSPTNGDCNNGNSGSASASASGGTAPYSYLWSNGETTASLSDLAAGTYSVTVTDSNGCTATCDVTVSIAGCCNTTGGGQIGHPQENCGSFDPEPLVSLAPPTGGLGDIEYVWLVSTNGGVNYTAVPNSNSETYDPGVISVTTWYRRCARRAGCTPYPGESNWVKLTVHPDFDLTCTHGQVSVEGGSDGSINLTVVGGTAPFTFQWSNGATTEDLNNLMAGVYRVLVTDANGCQDSTECCVHQPSLCEGFRTQTQGGWGSTPNGGNPGSYLHTNFSGAFPAGLEVGCTNKLRLTSAQAVTDFLPSGSTASALPSGTLTDPANSYRNVLAGQVVALKLSLTFDEYDASFGTSSSLLKNLIIRTGAFAGWSVQQAFDEAERKLGGCSSSYSYSDLNNIITAINESYVDGHSTGNLLECCTMTASAAKTDVSCNGGNDGTATATPQGGQAPYTYAWSNGATTATAAGLTAGTYSVTVTDNLGCQANASVTVGQPSSSVTASCDKEDAGCYGASTGSASVTAAGGTAPYTYAWSNGGSAASISNLAAGSYTVTVTDANGCTATCVSTVGQPSAGLSASCDKEDVDCYGASTGSASVTAAGGTAPYSYAWSNGGSAASINNLAAGSYTVTVTDANGCTATCVSTVGQPSAGLSASCDKEDVDCYGASTGSASVTAAGGTAPYSYAWSNGGSAASINNLAAGSYTVTVTDANGCTATCVSTVGQPSSGLSASCDKEDVDCYGASTGSASVTAAGGTAPYSYAWSNGGSAAAINNLAAGSYTVTVTDANGCTATCVSTVGQPSAGLSASCDKEDVDCYGASTGSASVTAAGGTAPYSYAWSNGGSAASIDNLAAGSYTVTVTDANGCTATCVSTVGQPSAGLSASCDKEDVDCYGASTGSASVTAAGGTAPYSYAWSNGGSSAAINNLAAGSYTVTVTDANGCTATCVSTVGQPSSGLSASCDKEDVDCYGASTGSASVTAAGGTAPYSYAWSNGGSAASINNLAAGSYTVTVTDANGCTATCVSTVGGPLAGLTANCTPTNGTCQNNRVASASVSASGGTAPYSYAWSNGGTGTSITNLAAGTYTVTVTDANNCTATCNATVTITPCCNVTFPGAIGYDQENCGPFDPAPFVSLAPPSGGLGDLEYIWIMTTDCNLPVTQWDMIPNSNTEALDFNGIITQTTCFIRCVRRSGCNEYIGESNRVTITINPAPVPVCSSEDADCFGASTGSVSVSVSGGEAPYTYAWNTGATTSTVDNLAAGTYTVTVTDANDCSATCNTTIGQASGLTADCDGSNVLCYGASTGSASVTAAGGTAPYSYAWSNGGNTASISNLAAGSYTVTVTDANGCNTTCSYTVTQPQAGLSASCDKEDVDCYGDATGSASVTASGGTAPYSYAWSNGGTTASISNLAAGTYTVTVTDANNCTTTCVSTVGQPGSGLTADCTPEDVDCYGGSNGSVSVRALGGTAPYTYAWSNGGSSDLISGLAAGTYTATVTDANGCTATCTGTVGQPSEGLTASCDKEDVDCYGASTGSASVTAAGGTAPYSYAWSNGGTAASINNLAAGSYTVTVTDANNCTAICSSTVGQPSEGLTASCDKEDVLCYGESTGSASVTAAGGTAPYSYAWSNGGTTASINNLAAGSYTVTVTDANGCIATCSSTVGQPSSGLSASCDDDDVSCYGGNDGEANVTASGGTAPYTYAWSNGETSRAIEDLTAGSYTVTVTDANGCTATCSATVGQPSEGLTADCDSEDAGCYGSSDGSASVTAAGGTAPYSYAWSNGGTNASISGLMAGTYSVTVTDANNCTATCQAVVGQASGLTADCDGSDVLCYGASTGSASVTAGGGTAPYSYAWSNGGSSASISNLAAGTYTVTVTDANGCQNTCSYTVSQPASAVTATCDEEDVDCYGASTGSASVVAAGGTAPYSYAWSNGGTTASISNLAAGSYTVTVTDANGCTTTCTSVVEGPSAGLTANCSGNNGTCQNGNLGSASVSAAGGTAPYSYAWSNGSTGTSISDLAAGTYSVTVTDANGCSATCSETITTVPCCNVTFPGAIGHDQENCGPFDPAPFVSLADPTGGIGELEYVWIMTTDCSLPVTQWTMVPNSDTNALDFNGIITETTCFIRCVRRSGCNEFIGESNRVTITINPGPEPVCTPTDAGCYGSSSGSVSVTVSGGEAPYSYAWSNGGTGSSITGVLAGTYTVTVTDANGCTGTCNATVNQASGLTADCDGDDVLCYGASTGSASVTAAGGTAPYTYAWSNGGSSASISNLSAGTYSVTVTDANNCQATCSYTVTQPSEGLTANCNKQDVLCYNGSTGSADVTAAGGTAPYTYAWSNGATTASISNLAAGTYTVTVTDANNCTATCQAVVGQPAEGLSANCSNTGIDCHGGTATASVTASGGTAPYTYEWFNGDTTSSISGLSAGNYTVLVTDANGCSRGCHTTIQQPSQLTAECGGSDVLCYGASTGSAQVGVVGGVAPYSYAWSNGDTTAAISNLAAGTYSVTVTDANNCTATCSYTVTQPSEGLTANCNKSDVLCYGDTTGSANVTAGGGTAPYSYAWSNGSTSASISGLGAGTYSVTVTDANGCTATCSATVGQPVEGLSINVTNTGIDCHGGTATASVTASGGTTPYSYEWFNGDTTTSVSGLSADTYTVMVTDANGCRRGGHTTIQQPPALTANCNSTDAGCYGAADGTADVTAGGGVAPYTYAWSNGGNTASISGLMAGTYTVTVTDANNCTATCVATVGQASGLTADCDGSDVLCYGASTGSASVTAGGGTAPYSYAWSNGDTLASISGLAAGTYTATVTDANGCQNTCSYTVSQPSEGLTADCDSDDVLCYGDATGSADVTAAGGTAPYSYAWSNGATTASISDIAAGTYTVTVTDANGCSATCSATVNQPSEGLTADCDSDDVLCYGDTTGSADVTAAGGTAPYSYAWSNGATTTSISDLAAGTYTVTVTDANGCTATCSATVNQPSAGLTADCDSDDADCFGSATGSADVTAAGGTAPYTYAWNNGSTAASLSNLAAGTYSVTVTDANGCTATCSTTINQAGELDITCSGSSVTCDGDDDGSASVTANGGTAPYTYSWSNGASSSSISNLGAGAYTVTVSDANGCSATCSYEVQAPSAYHAQCSATPVACSGADNGSVTVVINGGTAPYSYVWTNLNGDTVGTTATVDNLPAGIYGATVTDANGCVQLCTSIVEEAQSTLTATCGGNNGNCQNGNLGSASVNAAGGTAPYSYLWSNGDTTASIADLAAGTYDVTVTDANGCSATCSETITTVPCCNVTSPGVIGYDQENCGPFDAATLVSIAPASGGLGDLEYVWIYSTDCSLPVTQWAMVPGASGDTLDLGIISETTCFIRCARRSGCTEYIGESNRVTITINPGPIPTCTANDADCFGSQTGSVDVSVSGGEAPYTYAWSNGGTGSSISGVASGTYTVTVTDANGCSGTCSATVSQASGLTAECDADDALCYGAADGSASVDASGGTAPYSYLWSNGDTLASINGLVAGSYTVSVTDANGCMTTCVATVGEPEASVSANCNSNDVDCFGGATGSASVTAAGGTAPYTYLWNNNATTASISGLSAGDYEVTVTDANGCTATCETSVNEPRELLANCSGDDLDCYGDTDGQVSVSASQGTAPYSYLWNTGDTTASASGLAAGSYTVTVTDAHGCTTTCQAVVSQPASALYAECDGDDASCYGAADGSASVGAGGGTAPYSYAWSTGDTTDAISGLVAGTYTVTATDANGCTTTCVATVGQPNEALTSDCSNEPVGCNGGSNGSAYAHASGGTAPYTYLWSNDSTTADIFGLTAGSYTVTITDANGCTVVCSTTVSEESEVVANCSGSSVSCDGHSDGAASVSASGGVAPYTYLWSNGSTDASISGLTEGTYTVTVTDNYGCTATCSYEVQGPEAYHAQCENTNACPGASNGSVTVTINGGTAPYTYVWVNQAGDTIGTTATVDNLPAGIYAATVTDANGCVQLCTAVVGESQSSVDATCSGSDVLCYGDATGSVSVSATGGSAPYSYSWSTGDTTASVNNLAAGTYTVTVSDASGCNATCSYTVGGPQSALGAECGANDASCYGAADGSASVGAYGGTEPYSYLWSNGDTTDAINGLVADTYTVTVTDANGCTTTCTKTVGQPQSELTADCHKTNVACYGDSTGSVDVTAAGGTAPYSYLWSNGGTGVEITGLTAGWYSVTVTDANGCTASCSRQVGQPDTMLMANCHKVNVACYGDSTGSVDVTAAGGTAPYSYSWSNGGTGTEITGLTAGWYTVTITDANGCTASCSRQVGQPDAALAANCHKVNVACYGDSTGSVDVTAAGGTAPYVYAWSNGGTGTEITGLTAGWYTVTITDANGCTASCSRQVGQPDAPLASNCTTEPVACNGGDNGSAYAHASGGTAPYTYLWSNDSTTADIFGLTAGSYAVTVTDANGCTVVCSTTVNEESEVVANCSGTTITCDGDNDGTASVSGSGGVGPYTYLWSTGRTDSTIIGLSEGTYTVTVTDNFGCTATCSYEVQGPSAYHAECSSTDALCNGGATGSVTVTINGGTAPYTYLWVNLNGDTIGTTATVENLPAGIYAATVTDANGCVQLCSAVVGESNELGVNFEYSETTSCNANDACAASYPYGGTEPYTFSWSNGATTQDVCDLGPGTHSLTVIDANGCSVTESITIEPGNCPPIARNDFNNTIVNVPVDGDASTNDSDPDGDNLTFTQLTNPTNGSVVFNGDGTYTYTPNTDFVGDDSFMYYICDDGVPSLCDTATVFINVIDDPKDPFNNPPVANADDFVTYVNVPVNGTVITNDFDPDTADIITVTGVVSGPSHGTLTQNPDGSFTYVPDSNYVGNDSYIYSLCDNGTPGPLCDTALVRIHILTVPCCGGDTNLPPVAVDDAYVTDVNTPVDGDASLNDYDLDGDNLTFTQLTNPSNGSVVFNPDGSFTYTPNTGYVGPDHFVYYTCDDGIPSLCDTATVYITILTPGNNPPVARNDFNNTIVNVPVSGDASTNDFDPDGDNLTFTQLTNPTNGTVVFNGDGTYTYTPNTDFVGDDSYMYYICDDGNPSLCDTATVFITVIDDPKDPENNPPVANPDDFITYVNIPVNGTVITNDFDPDTADIITVTGVVSGPSHGTLTQNPDGSFTYIPDTDYVGDDTYTYSLCDNGTPGPLCDTAVVRIHILTLPCCGGDINLPPVAVDDAYTTDINTPVDGDASLNDYDLDGDNLTFTQLTNPSNGTVVFNPDGSFTYTPNTGYVGPDHFLYYTCDDGIPSLCDTATVYITILTPGNNPPVARNDFNNTLIDTPVDGDVSTNDYDPDGDNISFTQLTNPSHGTVVFNPTNGTYTYTPDSGYVGDDSYMYYICDDGVPSLCDTATVYITVIPVHDPENNPPVANPDDFITYVDVPVNGTVITNDFDPDTADIITVTGVVSGPSHGTLTQNPDGSFTYIPDPGYVGDDTYTYSLCDNGTPGPLCDTTVVRIHILTLPCCNPTNLPPVAVDDANITEIDTPVDGDLIVNDYDPNPGDIITINTTPITGPSNGSVVINPDGTYTYTPDPGYTGPDNFTYAICDNGTPGPLCDTATCYITVWSQMWIELEVMNPNCAGGCDGVIDLTVHNGTAPFTYAWSNGQTTEDLDSLCAGWYTVTVTDFYGTTVIDSAEVMDPEAFTVSITPDGPTEFCEGDSVKLEVNASLLDDILWSTDENTLWIFASDSGSYWVQVTNMDGCVASDTIDVNVHGTPEPEIMADGPTEFCEGDSVTLTASAGYVSYTWSTGDTTQSIVVHEEGDYYVSVVDSFGCMGVSDTTSVEVNENPTITISGGPLAFCEGGSAELTASGASTYVWSTGDTTATIVVEDAGTIYVTGTDTNGCVGVSDPVEIEVYPAPVPPVYTDGPTDLCPGNCVTLSTDSGYVSYFWSNADTTTSITVCEEGTYFVSVVDSNGCEGRSQNIIVNILETPEVQIIPDGPTAFCEGDSVELSAFTNATQYQWSTGDTTISTIVNMDGIVSVTVIDTNGCSAADSLEIDVYELPEPIVTGDSTICEGECTILAASGGFDSYTWSTGDDTQSIEVCEAGTYYVTVADSNGCVGVSDNFNVTVNPNPEPEITADGPLAFCEGGSVELTASEAADYLWSTSEITQSIIVDTTGSFYVHVVDSNGCAGTSDTVQVEEYLAPEVVVYGPTSFCEGECVEIYTDNFVAYSWSNNETTQMITVCEEGDYSVMVIDENGCEGSSDPYHVEENVPEEPTVELSGPTTFCEGESVTITVLGNWVEYQWYMDSTAINGATDASITVSEEGSYYAVVTDANGCSAETDPVDVEVVGVPEADAGPDETICPDESAILTATGGEEYVWLNQNGDTISTEATVEVFPTGETTYTVIVSNPGCGTSATDQVTISVSTLPTAYFISSVGGVGNPTNFTDMSEDNGTPIIGWDWDFGDGNSTSLDGNSGNTSHTYGQEGLYPVTLVVTNEDSCTASYDTLLDIKQVIFIPNVLTPNNDNLNDQLHILNSGVKLFTLSVYNRWGHEVFRQEGREIRWDGRTNSGVLLESGTYYYVLSIDNSLLDASNGAYTEQTGFITIIR